MSWQEALALWLVENPFLEHLGLAALELGALSLLLAVLLRLFRSASPRLVAFLWLIVLAKPLVSLFVSSPLEIAVVHAPSLDLTSGARSVPAAPQTSLPPEELRPERTGPPTDLPVQSERSAVSGATTGAAEPSATGRAGWRISPARLAVAMWLLGVLYLLVRHLLLRIHLHHLVRATEPAPELFHHHHRRIAEEMGLAPVPSLRVTEVLESPALVGLFRPVVLLPAWMVESGWDVTAEYALRHELSHCRWRDPLAILVRDLAMVAFYFHPAAWWARRRHLEALELACDHESMRDPSGAPEYAESLIRILERVREQRRAEPGGALAFAARRGVARRITALLDACTAQRLTRTGATAALLAAAIVFTVGVSVGQPEPALASFLAPHDHGHDQKEGSLLEQRPSLFLFGPFGERLDDLSEIVSSHVGNVFAREHRLSVYDALLEEDGNPFLRKPGDLLILLLTSEPDGRLPEKYHDLLPLPAAELDARLRRGETVECVGTARDLDILVLAAPTRDQVQTLLLTSERVQRIGLAPSVYALVPPGFESVLLDEIHGAFGRTLRRHAKEAYDELLDPGGTVVRRPGDGLVLLFTGDAGEDAPPASAADLLPEPWSAIQAALARGEDVQLRGRAHGFEVLLLAAPTSPRLTELVRTSPLLRSRGPVSRAGHDPARERDPDLFVMGSPDMAVWERVVANTSRGTSSKTGRPHSEAIYDAIFAEGLNEYDRSDGDLMVLLFCGADGDPLPAQYEDLLPCSRDEIEAALAAGQSLDLAGTARGLDIVVLVAPTAQALAELVDRTPTLARYRPGEEGKPGASGSLPPGTRYVVRFSDRDLRTASVSLEIPAGSGAVLLSFGDGARHLAGGYAHYLRSISGQDAGGNPIDVGRMPEGRFRVELGERPLVVHYEMALEHDASPWPEGGPDEAPYATDEDVFWTGRALFLAADLDAVQVEFQLPDEWRISTPWDPVVDRPDCFQVPGRRALSEAFLLAGKHAQWEASREGVTVLVAAGRSLGDGDGQLCDAVRRLIDAGHDLFGGTPPGRKLLVANVGPPGSPGSLNGGVFGNSISLLFGQALGAARNERWFPFVAHEIVHLWNGGTALRSSDTDYWFSEGFTEYYAYVLATRLGQIHRQDFLDRTREACEAYVAHAGSISLQEAGQPDHQVRELQYDGGFVAALVLDLLLRDHTAGRHGLDDLMREMFERFGQTQIPYSVADIAPIAAALAGDDLDGFFARYVQGTELLPFERELATAGVTATVERGDTLLARDYVIHEVLRIQSLTQTGEGLIVRRSRSTGYEDGDHLVAIGDEPVATFLDLQRVLRDLAPGGPVKLRIERQGVTLDLPLSLGGHQPPPLEHATRVRLDVDARSESAALDGILGS